jgi:hypothetical protein
MKGQMAYSCERDEKGVRIPQPGTKSRLIYDLKKQGVRTKDIAAAIGSTPNCVSVLLHRMRNWHLFK